MTQGDMLTVRPDHARKRLRPRVSVDTAHRFGDGLMTAGGALHSDAAAYIETQRARRLRKGDVYMRRCLFVFMLSLTGVLKSRQYSLHYYGFWVVTYLSCFMILPSVLPTDNTKIRVMLMVTGWNAICAFAVGLRFAVCKWNALDTCELEPWLCYFNICFWLAHACLAMYYFASVVRSVGWLAPAQALHEFWRFTGWYFSMVSLVTAVDLAVAYRAGKYTLEHYYVAFHGNAVIIVLQFTIGRLCHSPWFKNRMWRHAASVASIQVRQDTTRKSYPIVHCNQGRWILMSISLLFVTALLTRRDAHTYAVMSNSKMQYFSSTRESAR